MLDTARIKIYAGHGGKGSVAFRREKFIPRGGPSGGDGGNGGEIRIVADNSLSTLDAFRYKRIFKAKNGGNGSSGKMHGYNGTATLLRVPVGTEVWLENVKQGTRKGDKLLWDLKKNGQEVVAGQGGRGGRGNARFVTPSQREPVLAEDGETGQIRLLRLELKILADVGIIGLPNAGKSTLLSSISKARPKVASYPFTTLEPVLGVVQNYKRSLVAVDIPGLIEGASKGIGLGQEFLKHIQRARTLVHLVDGTEPDVLNRLDAVTNELLQFDQKFAEKTQIVVVNKIDVPELEERTEQLYSELRNSLPKGTRIYFISAAGRIGLEALIDAIFEANMIVLQESDANARKRQEGDEYQIFRPLPNLKSGDVAVRIENHFVVTHGRAVRLALGSDLSAWKAQLQMRDQLNRLGVTKRLRQLGAKTGDRISVGDWEFLWE